MNPCYHQGLTPKNEATKHNKENYLFKSDLSRFDNKIFDLIHSGHRHPGVPEQLSGKQQIQTNIQRISTSTNDGTAIAKFELSALTKTIQTRLTVQIYQWNIFDIWNIKKCTGRYISPERNYRRISRSYPKKKTKEFVISKESTLRNHSLERYQYLLIQKLCVNQL